jgi:hypothetical protein
MHSSTGGEEILKGGEILSCFLEKKKISLL